MNTIIISGLFVAILGLCSYIFVSNRSDVDERINKMEETLQLAIKTQNDMSVLMAAQDQRIKNIENKLKIKR